MAIVSAQYACSIYKLHTHSGWPATMACIVFESCLSDIERGKVLSLTECRTTTNYALVSPAARHQRISMEKKEKAYWLDNECVAQKATAANSNGGQTRIER